MFAVLAFLLQKKEPELIRLCQQCGYNNATMLNKILLHYKNDSISKILYNYVRIIAPVTKNPIVILYLHAFLNKKPLADRKDCHCERYDLKNISWRFEKLKATFLYQTTDKLVHYNF